MCTPLLTGISGKRDNMKGECAPEQLEVASDSNRVSAVAL
jgi:hypothetical protein